MAAACIILCGGRSSRMGRPKASLQWAGGPLLAHLVKELRLTGAPVILVASPQQSLPRLSPPAEVVYDLHEGLGPLNGFATGLRALPTDAESVYLSSCDLPLLRAAFVRRVLERLGSHDISLPVKDGFPQPLAAAYRVGGLLAKLETLLAAGSRRLVDLLPGADVLRLPLEEFHDVDPRLESLRNTNTADEYAELLRDFEGRDITS
ncbi:MAG: molybdenum cofactor guanylyltransferase [Gemmataceae bacterium]